MKHIRPPATSRLTVLRAAKDMIRTVNIPANRMWKSSDPSSAEFGRGEALLLRGSGRSLTPRGRVVHRHDADSRAGYERSRNGGHESSTASRCCTPFGPRKLVHFMGLQ